VSAVPVRLLIVRRHSRSHSEWAEGGSQPLLSPILFTHSVDEAVGDST